MVAVATSHLTAGTEEGTLAHRCETTGAPVYAVSDTVFAAMSPVRQPSGILAIARRPPTDLAHIYSHPKKFLLVVVDVQDPGNLGALIRAAEAGGVTGALVCGSSAHPYSWKALRGGMGSALRLPVASVPDAETCVGDLRAAGIRTVAAMSRDGRDPDAISWTGPLALVIGSEGAGLSDIVRAACDEEVTIPMASPVESLNVAVAAAILIYAARRQRAPRAHASDAFSSHRARAHGADHASSDGRRSSAPGTPLGSSKGRRT
jgi:TrmH family RNA methyltransferase